MKKFLSILNNELANKNYLDSLSTDNMNYLLTLNPNKLTGGKNITGIKNEILIKTFQVKSNLSIWIENNLDFLNNHFLSNHDYYYSPCIILIKNNDILLTKNNYNSILTIKMFLNKNALK